MLRDTIVDPESNARPDLHEDFVESDQTSADRGRRHLSNVHWDKHTACTHTLVMLAFDTATSIRKLTRPPTTRPTYTTSLIPYASVCIRDPMSNTMPEIIMLHLRPTLSDNGPANRLPKKHPACKRETMLASKALLAASEASLRPKSLTEMSVYVFLSNRDLPYFLKASLVIVVPINAKSYPKSKAPIEATTAVR